MNHITLILQVVETLPCILKECRKMPPKNLLIICCTIIIIVLGVNIPDIINAIHTLKK